MRCLIGVDESLILLIMAQIYLAVLVSWAAR
jgi:hypothetical protein